MNLSRSMVGSLLGSFPLFRDLPKDVQDAIRDLAEERRFAARETIIEEGKVHPWLYLIATGKLRVWTRSGQEVVELQEVGPGELVGEVGFLSGQSATATVEAAEPGLAFVFPRQELRDLLRPFPSSVEQLRDLTAHRAEDTIWRLKDRPHEP